jgi:nucleotide-binding universal stress UspA family protein
VGRRADHARRYQARFRPHAGFILASSGFAALLVALLLSAFHAPAPHDLPVGIAAPAAVTGQVENALGAGAPGEFDLHAYGSPAQVRAAIEHREADGGLIASRTGLRLLIAQAGGTGPAQALTRAFGTLAARSGRPLTVIDLVPPRPGDTEAVSPFFIILGVLFPSLAVGSSSALVFRRARPAWSVAAPIAAAVAIGATAAGIGDGVSGLGHYAVIAGIAALFSLAVSAPTAVLCRLWPPLTSAAVLVFMALGLPASGGPANLARFTAAPLRFLHPALPLSAAADAVRSAVYFGGYGTAGPAWVLAAWAIAGVAALTLTVMLRRPAAARPLSSPAGTISPARALANGDARPGASHAAVPDRLTRPLALSAVTGPGLAPGSPPGTTAQRHLTTLAEHVPDTLEPATIVVGFDNSGPARRALTWAVGLAATRQVALHVVYSDHAIIDSDMSGFAYAEMTATRDQQAAAVEQAAAQIIAAAGFNDTFPYIFRRLGSAPADAIAAAASTQAAAVPGSGPLIVVGRSGHAAHQVLGSVPVRLLHHSPYPVLAVP